LVSTEISFTLLGISEINFTTNSSGEYKFEFWVE